MYRGAEQGTVKIEDKKDAKYSRSEELRYDSVVAVNPGVYQCVLMGTDGKEQSRASLVAKEKKSYVVFRAGVEGDKYKPELVVYPKDEAPKSGASGASFFALFVALIY